MKTCFNHPERKAFSKCHGCGMDYCQECLDEGKEYYYCRRPECQSLRIQELSGKNETETFKDEDEPERIICPNCEAELELTEEEIEEKKVHCPDCEALIDLKFDPPHVLQRDNYIELLSSVNLGDIVLLQSILDDGKIDYYVFGERTFSADPFIFPVRFFVNADQTELARELLKNYDLKIFGPSANNYSEDSD